MISKIPAAPARPAVRSASPRGTRCRRCPRLGLTSATALALLLLSLSPAFGRDDRQTVQAPVHVMVPEENQVHLGLARNESEEYVVFDVANPETPKIVDRVEIGASISALSPSPMGTFIGTQSPRRDIFLRTREPASLRKVISLPGNGKILSLQPLGHLLLVLAEPVDAGSNSFVLDVSEPTKPKLQAQSRESSSRIAHKLRVPSQIAEIPSQATARLWRQHPTDPNYAIVGLAAGTPSFRVHPIQPEPLRFSDNNGDGLLQLACVGDSNTFAFGQIWPSSWCPQVAEEVLNASFFTTNHSVVGAVIKSNWQKQGAATLLTEALEGNPDAVLFALGTNDLPQLRSEHLAEDIDLRIVTLQALAAQAQKAGAQVFVALIPPRFDRQGPPEARELFNQAIRDNWSPQVILDFDSGFDASDFGPDGLHFNGIGHAKRAVRAAEFLQADPTTRKSS